MRPQDNIRMWMVAGAGPPPRERTVRSSPHGLPRRSLGGHEQQRFRYLVLNSINDAKYQRFKEGDQSAGHDNFNYLVGTWSQWFSERIHEQTEAYFMCRGGRNPRHRSGAVVRRWQLDRAGYPRFDPYGVVNCAMFGVSKRDYFTVRNEWWRDEERSASALTTRATPSGGAISSAMSS